MSKSIIVYRNPAEKAFWELASSGDLIPLVAAIIAAGIMFAFWGKIVNKLKWHSRTRAAADYVLFLGIVMSIGFGYGIWRLLAL